MELDKAADKVRKLLRLAQSPNVHEAGAAAAAAQALMLKHALTRAALEIETPPGVTDPASGLYDTQAVQDGSLHVFRKARNEIWISVLAAELGQHNSCVSYTSRNRVTKTFTLEVVGRPDDVGSVRYLFAYLTKEISRLADVLGKGKGKVWRNSFKRGATQAVANQLREMRRTTLDELRRQAVGSQALMKLKGALARRDEEERRARNWVEKTHNMKPPAAHRPTQMDPEAYSAGVNAGLKLYLGKGKPLGTGPVQIAPTPSTTTKQEQSPWQQRFHGL